MIKQYGGRLIGAGVHGCTFEPAPRCAGGDVFRTIEGLPAVGKITDEDPREELRVGRAIMKLPLADAYFALPTASCVPADGAREDPDVRRCGVITEAGATARLSMLLMPAAGQQLAKWAAASPPRLAEEYKRMFVHLLEGMLLYQAIGYVHNDIHMGNILVDKHDVARFIDFGLAFNVNAVNRWSDTNLNRKFNPDHVLQAPEVHAWRMYLSGVRLQDGLDQLTTKHKEYAQLVAQYPARKTPERALAEFLGSDYVKNEDIAGFVKLHGFGIDCWRIGLTFWWLWNDLLPMPGLRNTALWSERDRIRQVLSGLTDFDYRTRMSVHRALELLDPGNKLLAVSA